VFSFFYLLIVGSLTGFVAYMWLLGHVPVALAGTYAYVNPMVALIVGWALANEALTTSVVAGMLVILLGVALVRASSLRQREAVPSARNQLLGWRRSFRKEQEASGRR
jgi:drug/metabolite transporter (DMT)-like permease